MSRAVADLWNVRFRPKVAAFARYPERRRVTASGVIGDATAASRAKGLRLLAVLDDRLEALCRDLHGSAAAALPRGRQLLPVAPRMDAASWTVPAARGGAGDAGVAPKDAPRRMPRHH